MPQALDGFGTLRGSGQAVQVVEPAFVPVVHDDSGQATCLTERSCLPYGKGSAPSQSLRGLRLRVSAPSAPAAFGLLILSWRRASRWRHFVIANLWWSRQLHRAAKQSDHASKRGHTEPEGKPHKPRGDISARAQHIESTPAGHVVEHDEQKDNQT